MVGTAIWHRTRAGRPQGAAQRPAQLVLCQIAVPTTLAQTVSWSIPIITIIMNIQILLDKAVQKWQTFETHLRCKSRLNELQKPCLKSVIEGDHNMARCLNS